VERLEERDAEALVLGQRDEHAGAGEPRGERRGREPVLERHGARSDRVGELAQPGQVRGVERLADEHEARAGQPVAPQQRDEADQLVLALVRRHPPDEQQLRRRRAVSRRLRRAEPRGIEEDRDDRLAAELGRVEGRHAGDEVGARGERGQLAASERALDRDHRLVVPEPPRRGDVVAEQQRRVRQVQDRAQLRRVGRVVDEQHVAALGAQLAQRPDRAVHARVDVHRDVAPAPAPRAEPLAPAARLRGHGVDGAGAAEDLVDDHGGGLYVRTGLLSR
jgi:hypothetical protein